MYASCMQIVLEMANTVEDILITLSPRGFEFLTPNAAMASSGTRQRKGKQ